MLRRILFICAAAIGLSGTAMAADLGPLAPVYVAPAFTWTGFYVGVNAGAAWGNVCRNVTPFFPAIASGWPGNFCTSSKDNVSVIGGGQLVYNWQVNAFVLGLEADFQGLSSGNRNGSSFVLASPFS